MSSSETPRPSAAKLRIIAPPPVIFFGTLIAAIALDLRLLHLPRLPAQSRFAWIALIAAGFALITWAISTLIHHKTAVNPYKKTTNIVSDGPFRFSRNPIYLAMAMIYLGVTFGFLSTLALILLPAVMWLMHWGVITREEKYLEAAFGDAYTTYKLRVRRWL